jgi:hypothetical protein
MATENSLNFVTRRVRLRIDVIPGSLPLTMRGASVDVRYLSLLDTTVLLKFSPFRSRGYQMPI